MLLTSADDRILRSFAVLHFLTAAQTTRLWYSSGSSRYVSARLKNLTDHRYLTRLALSSESRVGSVPYVYFLAQRGSNYLIRLGYDLLRRSTALRTVEHASPFLAHALAVTDVLIAAIRLPKYESSIAVSDIRHDLTLKRLLHGFVVPDGFMDFRLRGTIQQCFLLEVDRGTESKAQIQHKLEGLLRLIQPPTFDTPSVYEQLFATTSLTIVYAIVSQPEKRLEDIIRWTEEMLTKTGYTQERDLFRFVILPEGPVDPAWFFLTPIWRWVAGTSLVPLIEV
jgi:hypothetical protein